MENYNKYNMTKEDYNNLFNKQLGKCAICGTHQNSLTYPLHVDHDHEYGRVRGLLCVSCNVILGKNNDNAYALEMKALKLKKKIQHLYSCVRYLRSRDHLEYKRLIKKKELSDDEAKIIYNLRVAKYKK